MDTLNAGVWAAISVPGLRCEHWQWPDLRLGHDLSAHQETRPHQKRGSRRAFQLCLPVCTVREAGSQSTAASQFTHRHITAS